MAAGLQVPRYVPANPIFRRMKRCSLVRRLLVGAGGGLHLGRHLVEREAAGRLARREVPEGAEVSRDIGVRGNQQEDAIDAPPRIADGLVVGKLEGVGAE